MCTTDRTANLLISSSVHCSDTMIVWWTASAYVMKGWKAELTLVLVIY